MFPSIAAASLFLALLPEVAFDLVSPAARAGGGSAVPCSLLEVLIFMVKIDDIMAFSVFLHLSLVKLSIGLFFSDVPSFQEFLPVERTFAQLFPSFTLLRGDPRSSHTVSRTIQLGVGGAKSPA